MFIEAGICPGVFIAYIRMVHSNVNLIIHSKEHSGSLSIFFLSDVFCYRPPECLHLIRGQPAWDFLKRFKS